jgi:germination protein M
MHRRFSAVLLALVVAISVFSMLAAGCAPKASGSADPTPVNPVPSASYVDLVLFFGDDQAMEVLPELRRIEVPSDPSQRASMPVLVVQELLKGPTDPLLNKTLPPEAKLLSVEVANGVAYVNFSKELQTKHWGGSAGEIMTIWSLVTSLTQAEPPESASPISKVQILVEGKTVETLAGHFDISKSLEREVRFDNPFFTSDERAEALQKRVDEGEDEWRKDPLQVAKIEGPARGLLPDLDYVLKSESAGKAEVEVVHEGKTYRISLVQPEKQGEGGVWVIGEISR